MCEHISRHIFDAFFQVLTNITKQANRIFVKDDQWFEDSRDFLSKLVLIGTNKNLSPPRQPEEFSRVIQNWEIWGKARQAESQY